MTKLQQNQNNDNNKEAFGARAMKRTGSRPGELGHAAWPKGAASPRDRETKEERAQHKRRNWGTEE